MSALARLCALGVLIAPALAHAGNGTHVRTPVKWDPRPACMTIVDRSVDPVFEFNYTIPYEDLRPVEAVDEVDDSRTHQFLAFCRAHSVQESLPPWLSEADVAAAAAKELVDPATVGPEDVFDTSTEWQGCFVRITGDDERRLINFAEAAKPVVWDTTGLPVGAYVINGYTWEPLFNIYSLRPGVVKIVDDPDPAASPPALAIANQLGEEIVWETEQLRLHGCVSAMEGSTLTGYWAHTDVDGGALEWNVFTEGAPVTGDEFELWFAPPKETVTKLIVLRVDVTDPMDRTYVAHMDLLASVLAGGPPAETSGGCDSGSFIAEPGCGSSGGDGSGGDGTGEATSTGAAGDGPTGGSSGGGSADGTTGPTQAPPGAEGCGCATGGSGGSLAWLVVLALLRRGRARRGDSRVSIS